MSNEKMCASGAKQKLKKASYWLSIISIGIVLGISLQFVRAWVEPAQLPPGGNIGAPINTGIVSQTKGAGLGLTGSLVSNQNIIAMGNVGIGTSSPTQRLDVAGYVKGQSGLCIGNDCRTSWPGGGMTYVAGAGQSVYKSPTLILAVNPYSGGGSIPYKKGVSLVMPESGTIRSLVWFSNCSTCLSLRIYKNGVPVGIEHSKPGMAWDTSFTVSPNGVDESISFNKGDTLELWFKYGQNNRDTYIKWELHASSGPPLYQLQASYRLMGVEEKEAFNQKVILTASPPDTQGCSCFVKGSKVLMADGSNKNIEEISVGDEVMGEDRLPKKVIKLERPFINDRGTFILNGKTEFTGEHPFLTTEGWKVADVELFRDQKAKYGRYNDIEEPTKLEIGDLLITEGGTLKVESINKTFARPQSEIVYDLMLEGGNKYYVNGFLVKDSK